MTPYGQGSCLSPILFNLHSEHITKVAPLKVLGTSKYVKAKGKTVPVQAWRGSECSKRLRLPEFQENQHMNFVRLSVSTGHLYSTGNNRGTHFC